MASGPVAGILTVAVLAVSAFCTGRLLLAIAWRRPTERDVDVVHVVMGVSMAGMFTGWLTGAWTDVWVAAFVGSTLWFGRGVVRELSGRATTMSPGGHVPHLVASVAMLYMLLAMHWTGMSAMDGSHPAGSGSSGSLLLPVLVAVLVIGDAAVVAGRGLLQVAPAGPHAATSQATGPSGAGPSATLAPRASAACLLVMSLAMAYMVVTVRP